MIGGQFLDNFKRKTIVTGHYGSGKTEFTVSLAMLMTDGIDVTIPRPTDTFERHAIIDLDIINPYFRSREQRDMLKNVGIDIYGSAFDTESTAEVPALSAKLRAPLDDKSCRVLIDTGGNDAGAVVLNQFTKYFTDDETAVLAVVNANRPDTSNIDTALEHIESIEFITNLNVSYIVNNTHMLRETAIDDITRGYELCSAICERTGKQLLCTCYPEGIINPDDLNETECNLMPLGLYMRPTWLDK